MEFDTTNRRRKAITDFRLSYNDNRKNTVSTDKNYRKTLIVRGIAAAVCFLFFVLAGFLLTDSLITISEKPYVHEEKTAVSAGKEIDKKYFKDYVTVPAADIEEKTGTIDKE